MSHLVYSFWSMYCMILPAALNCWTYFQSVPWWNRTMLLNLKIFSAAWITDLLSKMYKQRYSAALARSTYLPVKHWCETLQRWYDPIMHNISITASDITNGKRFRFIVSHCTTLYNDNSFVRKLLIMLLKWNGSNSLYIH